METLVECELVERVEPEQVFDQIPDFEAGFLVLLDRAELARRSRPERDRTRERRAARDTPDEPVHLRKFRPISSPLQSPAPSEHSSSRRGPGDWDTSLPLAGSPTAIEGLFPDQAAQPEPDWSERWLDVGSSRNPYRVHREKATLGLFRELGDRGHIRGKRTGTDGQWMPVEGWVASLYMAYLALCLGQLTNLEPITDERAGIAAATGVDFSTADRGIDRMRSVMLANVLPAPSSSVPPDELARFKAKNWDELRAFRIRVERSLVNCAKEPDPVLRERSLRLEAEALEDDVLDLERRMAKRRWPTARGMLVAGFASAPAAAALAASGSTSDLAGALSPVVAEVAASILGSAPSDRRDPVAYAALARDAFLESLPSSAS
jgi:hypothetical protein